MSIASGTILKIAQNILLPDTQTAVNVFWATIAEDGGAGPLDDADALEAASNWMDQLYANISGSIADTVASTIVEMWTVNPVDGDLTPVGDEATTWDGLSANDALPNGVAGICTLKTVNSDVTGRKFIPCFHEGAFLDNNMTSTPLAQLVLFAVDWADQYIDVNNVIFNPGVWSMTKLNFYLASGTVIANAIAGYQRRRKPGVGS